MSAALLLLFMLLLSAFDVEQALVAMARERTSPVINVLLFMLYTSDFLLDIRSINKEP